MNDHDTTQLELSPLWERAFIVLSLVLAIASLLITGTDLFSRAVPSWMIVVKEFLIFGVLLILMLFFFLRYRQVLGKHALLYVTFKTQVDLLNRLINEQSNFYHQVIRQTRASFYSEFGPGIYPYRFNYRNPALKDIMEKSLDAAVTVVLNIVKNQLAMRGISERVSISVKGIVTGPMARSLCELTNGQKAKLKDDETYIITLERDADTMALFSEREVRQTVYERHENTDFSRILSGENADDFLSNDLEALEKAGYYKNNNAHWREYYNASLVVPIAHRETDAPSPTIYGFLTVDSKNEGKHLLFSKEETRPIMAFGADLLALIFLMLEIYDRLSLVNPPDEPSAES